MISNSEINIFGRIAIVICSLVIIFLFNSFFIDHIYDFHFHPTIWITLGQYVCTLVLMGIIGVGAWLIYYFLVVIVSVCAWVITGYFSAPFDSTVELTKDGLEWALLFLFGDWNRFWFLKGKNNGHI